MRNIVATSGGAGAQHVPGAQTSPSSGVIENGNPRGRSASVTSHVTGVDRSSRLFARVCDEEVVGDLMQRLTTMERQVEKLKWEALDMGKKLSVLEQIVMERELAGLSGSSKA